MWERKEMEKWKRLVGGGTQLMKVMEFTYHDDATWLLCRAHAHDGSHANGGALEIHPTEGEKEETVSSELPKLTNSVTLL